MDDKNTLVIMAGISVGSCALRMNIAEVLADGKIRPLEIVSKSIALGRDTFSKGKVSYEVVNEICEVLKGFKKLMSEYKVKTYRAVATSGIREAENKDYILDQIYSKTGLKIEIINSSVKRFLTYKAIRENLQNHEKIREEGSMVLDIGSGNIEVSIYQQGNLTFSQNLKLGSLRLKEVLSELESKTLDFPKLLEDYIKSNTDILAKTFDMHSNVKHFIVLGDVMKDLSKLCDCNNNYIEKDRFFTIYQNLLYKPSHKILSSYKISKEGAYTLMPSLILLKVFLGMTSSPQIYAPLVNLEDGIVADLIDQKLNTKRKQEFLHDIFTLVRSLAKKYRYDENHANEVMDKSLRLFDGLKRLHGLGEEERFLLQLATILHDVGKFININQHYNHSYDIIMASNIMGISQQQLEIIANIAKYHSTLTPTINHKNFNRLSHDDRVIIAKLVSIIRIADALDRSHQQKVKNIEVKLQENKMIIKATTAEEILLEEWTFEAKSFFFQEVFGITPILHIKREI
ncbi:HD domain-containing protein [Clostridium formicaceticum]|uniref:Exopolyphosphatase n=1 Tax=Clostridium formicaceticum TaxID=1497 RepID=A0AAC9RHP7_9CLOT|nr:HD domain-containing protein [Clostridium formicaceticum]AOY75685.1 hypothetical protein BJL90_07120 [Clostridium formicaceticum]ARE86002.1 Exopolyphosphatase [Clostridium formicaceticum]